MNQALKLSWQIADNRQNNQNLNDNNTVTKGDEKTRL
jgi:hypothetical protein